MQFVPCSKPTPSRL